MKIQHPCVVRLSWRLEDTLGHLIEELTEPAEFFYRGEDLFDQVEEVLDGQEAGFETRLQLEPEHAFGDYRPALVCFEARGLFPEDVSPGLRVLGLPPGAVTPDMPADVLYTVTEVYDEHVVLDGNHPLAGIALRISLKVTEVREATEAETEAGTLGEPLFQVLSGARPDGQQQPSHLH